jgi:hypothetical protein
MFNEKNAFPEMAFLFSLSVPFQDDNAFQSQFVATEFRLLMSHTINERFSISYNLGGEWDGDRVNSTGLYTLSLGIKLSKKVGAFIETYGFFTQGEKPDNRLDGGFTYLFNENFQADISSGMELIDKWPKYFIGAGLSLRLPKI